MISLTIVSFFSHWLVSTAFSLRDFLNHFVRRLSSSLDFQFLGAASGLYLACSQGSTTRTSLVRLPLSVTPQASLHYSCICCCAFPGKVLPAPRAGGTASPGSPSCARVLAGRPSVHDVFPRRLPLTAISENWQHLLKISRCS